MSSTQQAAVTGTMTGAVSVTAGRIRPIAARSSRIPSVLTKVALACCVQLAGWASSFSLGRNVLLMPPASAIRARKPVAIQSARFMVCSFWKQVATGRTLRPCHARRGSASSLRRAPDESGALCGSDWFGRGDREGRWWLAEGYAEPVRRIDRRHRQRQVRELLLVE